MCWSWAPFNQRGAAAVTINPPGTINIPKLKFCSYIFRGSRLISHPLTDRIRRHLFRYYRKVIWNLLEIHYWLVSSMTSSQSRTRAMSENIGRVVVPQLLFFFNFCHFVALGKCEYLLHVQRIAIHLNCTSQLGDCLNSHEIHENYFSPPCIHSLHPRVAPAGIHWDPWGILRKTRGEGSWHWRNNIISEDIFCLGVCCIEVDYQSII